MRSLPQVASDRKAQPALPPNMSASNACTTHTPATAKRCRGMKRCFPGRQATYNTHHTHSSASNEIPVVMGASKKERPRATPND